MTNLAENIEMNKDDNMPIHSFLDSKKKETNNQKNSNKFVKTIMSPIHEINRKKKDVDINIRVGFGFIFKKSKKNPHFLVKFFKKSKKRNQKKIQTCKKKSTFFFI